MMFFKKIRVYDVSWLQVVKLQVVFLKKSCNLIIFLDVSDLFFKDYNSVKNDRFELRFCVLVYSKLF